ncbi:MAG TPA: hypothetical protein VGT44_19810, partial [Ktedonobacteraceae bacterium]|nr:hypothetical protein [Ktedonobacteraceae bacterium]
MPGKVRITIGIVTAVAVVMALVLGLHVGGKAVLRIGLYSQLAGAFIGGFLAIISVNFPLRRGEQIEPWLRRERLAWTLIGA